jgi:hypothetical protein
MATGCSPGLKAGGTTFAPILPGGVSNRSWFYDETGEQPSLQRIECKRNSRNRNSIDIKREDDCQQTLGQTGRKHGSIF